MGDNLRQLGQQLLEIWKQLGVSQRVSVVLGAGVVLGGLVGLMLWSNRPDYALLYGKLDDAEAAKVIAALEDARADGVGGLRSAGVQDAGGKLLELGERDGLGCVCATG